jgi:hypothetical protein
MVDSHIIALPYVKRIFSIIIKSEDRNMPLCMYYVETPGVVTSVGTVTVTVADPPLTVTG